MASTRTGGWPGWSGRLLFPPKQQHAVILQEADLIGYVSQEHKVDGSHGAITADSLTVNPGGTTLGPEGISTNAIYRHGYAPEQGVWTPYTPVWISSGSPPSAPLANAQGKYTLIGNTCHFYSFINFDASVVLGTGTWFFGLPTLAATPNGVVIGAAQLYDVDVELAMGLVIVISTVSGGVNLCIVHGDHAGTYISPTVPFVWANGDGLRINGTYEIA